MRKSDKKLLCALRAEAFQTMKGLSKNTGIPIPTLYYKIKQLKEKQIIRKTTVLMDFKKLGYPLHILLYLDIQDIDFSYFLGKNEVNTMYELDNAHSCFMECYFESGAALDRFLTALETTLQPKKVLFWVIHSDNFRERFLG